MGLLSAAPKVHNCCFYFELVNGAKLVAVCQALGWFLYGASVVHAFTRIPKFAAQFDAVEAEKVKTISYAFLWLELAFCVLGFCFSICLLYGVIKRNARYVKIWLYAELVTFALFQPVYFWIYFNSRINSSIDAITFGVVYVCLRVYWWLSVNTLHSKLELIETGEVPNDLPNEDVVQEEVKVHNPVPAEVLGDVYHSPRHSCTPNYSS